MVECFENDHKVNSKCFICNSIIVLLRDDLNTVYIDLHVAVDLLQGTAALPGSTGGTAAATRGTAKAMEHGEGNE